MGGRVSKTAIGARICGGRHRIRSYFGIVRWAKDLVVDALHAVDACDGSVTWHHEQRVITAVLHPPPQLMRLLAIESEIDRHGDFAADQAAFHTAPLLQRFLAQAVERLW